MPLIRLLDTRPDSASWHEEVVRVSRVPLAQEQVQPPGGPILTVHSVCHLCHGPGVYIDAVVRVH